MALKTSGMVNVVEGVTNEQRMAVTLVVWMGVSSPINDGSGGVPNDVTVSSPLSVDAM